MWIPPERPPREPPLPEVPSNEPPSNEPMSPGVIVVVVLFGLIPGPMYIVQGLETEGLKGIVMALCGLSLMGVCLGMAGYETWRRRR